MWLNHIKLESIYHNEARKQVKNILSELNLESDSINELNITRDSGYVIYRVNIADKIYVIMDSGQTLEVINKNKPINKEDIEKRGWIFKYEYNGWWNFEKGDVWKDDGQGAFLSVGENNKILIKVTNNGYNSDGPNISTKFNGVCDTMDEFDVICRMIKLKI